MVLYALKPLSQMPCVVMKIESPSLSYHGNIVKIVFEFCVRNSWLWNIITPDWQMDLYCPAFVISYKSTISVIGVPWRCNMMLRSRIIIDYTIIRTRYLIVTNCDYRELLQLEWKSHWIILHTTFKNKS